MLGSLIVFLAILIGFWYWKSCRHPKGFPPGPRLPIPVFGDAYVLGNDLAKGFSNLSEKYGKVCGFWLGTERAAFVADFDLLQDILHKSETVDRQTKATSHVTRRGLSFGSVPGVLFSSGPTWVQFRRSSLHILRNFGFGKAALEDIIEEEVDNLFEHIDQNYLNQPVEVSRFFNIAVLSSLWRIISGERLKVGDPKLEHLVETVSNLTKEFGRPVLAVSMNNPYLFSILHYFGVLKFLSYTNKIFDFVMDTISSHKSKHIDGEHPLTFTEAMLHKIHQTHEKDDPFHGDVGELNLMNVLLDLFVAGSDTTSITLNWAMLYMILNQDIQKNVRKELNESIGRQRKAKMAEKYLTPYTEAVIHEIQRRGNIVPLSVFHCIQENDTQTSFQVGQHKLPPKTVLIPLIGEVMHDPLYFPNPTRFDPKRYLSEEENGQITFKPHPRVIPFGIGKRRCLGEVLARMTLYKFFTAIVQKYEIVSGQDEPITDEAKTGFTRSPIDYRIIFRPIL